MFHPYCNKCGHCHKAGSDCEVVDLPRKPCPFCGMNASGFTHMAGRAVLFCSNCGAYGPSGGNGPASASDAMALELWNTREIKTPSNYPTGGEAILRVWWSKMPDWAKKAYHNDPTVQCVVVECSRPGITEQEMLWRLIKALYKQRNQWRDKALHL